ncbi:ABC transporter ATP-binding protein [Paenibacillus sedimenti]|uniref:ABC transporter ATP-binding protein n=1 Tax=Paenibacillus sedimenti TaxID=2770274 RepID=A0A926QIN2_9BACL|nr:ABC transporter ATP-binding protein [Paenibacillus sedimenti]MBD0379689.1 ABC transporter ATP-binding protein [Paenibacillus sedimenti]
MESKPVISIQNVIKTYKVYDKPLDRLKQSFFRGRRQYYKEFTAVNNVSLDIMKGETVGIIGRNGSGKSTLLQMIAGTLTPTSGHIEVSGKVAALLELGSGFNPDFTGRENVYMNGAILGLDRIQIDKLFDDIASFADIGDFIEQPVKTYSSGMYVRLAFAVQALIPKEILIVDEALSVGDELFQRKCFAKIDEFKKQGGTILFVSHSGGSIIELCDRAVLMDSGECLIVGRSKRIVNLYQKFIYAPASKKDSMRKEIKNLNANETIKEVVVSSNVINGREELSNSSRKNSAKNQAMYDPELKVHDSVHYESRGVEIFDPQILTLSGEKVNLLISGEKYVWRYFVKFHKSSENVRFGMMLKPATGLELGGAATALQGQGIPQVIIGQVFQIDFMFVPRLNAGTYFLNGGVVGITEEGEVYLERKIDLAVFKILYEEEALMTGIVDFSISSEYTEIS